MIIFIPLFGASIALVGSLALVALGVLVIIRRTESNGLFAEDQRSFIIAKIILAVVMILMGFSLATSAVNKLVAVG